VDPAPAGNPTSYLGVVPRFVHAVEVVASGRAGDDRAAVISIDDGIVIALADGAGGTGGGAKAAQAIVDAVIANPTLTDWAAALVDLDDPARLGGGQTTAVILHVTADGIAGASVGDSGAWIIRDGVIEDLTVHQVRKPLVGASCEPIAFGSGPLGEGTLIVASDGLLRYANRKDIMFVVERDEDVDVIARRLIDLVRLPNDTLPDDVAVVVCRSRVAR
jgi:PPM family protein phosphatase